MIHYDHKCVMCKKPGARIEYGRVWRWNAIPRVRREIGVLIKENTVLHIHRRCLGTEKEMRRFLPV